jgi:hypothetical protein
VVGGRRLHLAGIAALIAVVAAGASVQPAGAGSDSTILFTAVEPGLNVVSIGGGSSGPSIEVDLAPDTPPLPRKVVIEVPAGYTLDLDAKPGAEVGDATISIVTAEGPSFATGLGELVARGGDDAIADPRLRVCASGSHAARWSLSTSLAGRQVSLLVSVDAATQTGVAYVLTICTSSLASDTKSAATISLGLDGIVAPTAPGDYRWRALVTPESRPGYELQALLPLPEALTIRARYDRKHKRAVLTGRVIEGGQALSRADVVIAGERNNRTVGLTEARTNAQGVFTQTMRVTGTTDFTVFAGPTIGLCTATSSQPDGCLGATTIPPDPALTTLWVSPPTGAVRAIRAADQRRAEQLGLSAADFPADFTPGAVGGDDCLNPRHESKLTITGESGSPDFGKYVLDDPPSLVDAVSLSRVYATGNQARRAFEHQARATTVRCILNKLELEPNRRPAIRALRLPKVSAQMRAFRAVLAAEDGLVLTYDVVFLQRGRAVTILELALLNAPADLETRLTAALAARMR